MRALGPAHAGMMILVGVFGAQALGGILAVVGFAIAVATGGIERSAFESSEGIVRVMAHPLVLVPSAVGSSLGLLAVAVVTPTLLRIPVRDALAIRRPPALAWILGPLGAVGFGFVADQSVFYFARAFPDFTLGALAAFGEASRVRGVPAAAALLVGMALVPGTCEEIFFRGAVQGALASRWSGAAAVAVTSIAFGLVHVDPPQAVGASVLGVYLGVLTLRSRSVGPAIAAHVVNNAIAFTLSNVGGIADVGYGTDAPIPWLVVVAGFLLAAAALLGVRAPPAGKIPNEIQ